MRTIFICLILISFLNAQTKEFYYSFMGSEGKQIPEKTQKQIIETLQDIDSVRELYYEGYPKEAFEKIEEIKNNNKLSILKSEILLLYAELTLKFHTKKLLFDVTNELEQAVNEGFINQEDLLQAYLLLVELKLSINKIDEAKYYSETLINIFEGEKAKIRGKISLSKIYRYQKNYSASIKVLYEALALTNDRNEASNIANELFDVYLLEGRKEEAKDVMTQILFLTPSFYSNDFLLANKKVDTLLKLNINNLAISILKDLILQSKKADLSSKSKFKLANIYMNLYKGEKEYLMNAKILYKNIMDNYPNSELFNDSKMYYDEIRMRQKEITPSKVSEDYIEDEDMQNKAVLQELLNNYTDLKYEDIVKLRKIYEKIPRKTLNRFNIENTEFYIDNSFYELIKYYIKENDCLKLRALLKDVKQKILENILEEEILKDGLISCIKEEPSKDNYEQLREILKDTKDENIYLVLENIAFGIDNIDDAVYYSSKITGSKNKKLLEEEFLLKYQVLKQKNDSVLFDRFLKNSFTDKDIILNNSNHPMIIDFYYDLYMYFVKNEDEPNAKQTMKDLDMFQNNFKVFIYSPLVEFELSKINKEAKEYNKAIENLLNAIKNTRNIKSSDEVKIYYELVNLYIQTDNKDKKSEYLQKCKEVKIEDNLYKTMCESIK
ncbi:tetratricopeptide repeat protein [Aliarcobacter thereius]|uniref:Tetratricopeptide repeat protein n=1 Tax=Aliarcobacter thereius LMG 24486 TaxID=1032240 RepID=A0A1C7WLS0_9BACT|nr:hypothetical protein [Aliarcobacter thereius]OCL92243.1 hypothetical protein AAX25_00973 [Aliarcobacter thereius]OCL94661.1 hypothetical protein AA347_00100 [Aliarcobacter thereius LMG 24486]QBF15463.1 hypothetical protein ATH_0373 [Aliarcobacter thereius LMG 24486]TLS93277.1 hypothetical protein FE244_04785 [Aliarcobacter thereius]